MWLDVSEAGMVKVDGKTSQVRAAEEAGVTEAVLDVDQSSPVDPLGTVPLPCTGGE